LAAMEEALDSPAEAGLKNRSNKSSVDKSDDEDWVYVENQSHAHRHRNSTEKSDYYTRMGEKRPGTLSIPENMNDPSTVEAAEKKNVVRRFTQKKLSPSKSKSPSDLGNLTEETRAPSYEHLHTGRSRESSPKPHRREVSPSSRDKRPPERPTRRGSLKDKTRPKKSSQVVAMIRQTLNG
jgi:hypothetical protein